MKSKYLYVNSKFSPTLTEHNIQNFFASYSLTAQSELNFENGSVCNNNNNYF